VIRPERPAWELSMQRVGHTVLAVLYAAAAALIVWKLSIWRVIGPTFGLVFYLVTFVVFAVVFYYFLDWLFRKRPDEIAKRVSTPGKELRRRKKQYFDNC
jgi:glucan phosphoethanolaminetransferase (alkaline phosphatase superfamily)